VCLQSKHLESERELQRHQESYLRREQQLLARLAEVEERLRQQSGQAMSDSTAGDADDIDGEYDSDSPGQHRSSTHKAPSKDQPLTLEAVQDQVRTQVLRHLHSKHTTYVLLCSRGLSQLL
jgi:predicted transcriptional regulator